MRHKLKAKPVKIVQHSGPERLVMPEPRNVYLAMKHLNPDVIRRLRLALDSGCNVDEFKSKPTLFQIVRYMESNPLTGVVSKWDGQYYHFEA